jgi:hypothetical protein
MQQTDYRARACMRARRDKSQAESATPQRPAIIEDLQ